MRSSGAVAWAHLFVIRATSGWVLVAGLSSFVVALVVGTTADATAFLPGIADPLNLSLTACLYMGPVGAGAAAVQMAGFHRLGLVDLASSTPRGLTAAKWLEAGPVIAWQLVAYVALVILLLSRSDLDGAASVAMALLPLQAVVLLTVTALVGAAAADALRPRLIAPLVSGTLFVLLFALALQTGGLSRFSPVYTDIFYQVPLQPHRQLLVAMTSMLAAIGLIAVASMQSRRRSRALTAAVGSVGLSVAAGV